MGRLVVYLRALAPQAAISAAVGAGIITVIEIGAGGFPQARLLASGAVIGLSIWACCTTLFHLLSRRLPTQTAAVRLTGTVVLLLLGALLGWTLSWPVNRWLVGVRYATSPHGLAISLGITAILVLAVGGAFVTIEALRKRLEVSIEELKAREYAEKELEVAAAIQRRLLPPDSVDVKGLEIRARHLPARHVAGDFWDLYQTADGGVAVAIADVLGKGMGASLIMASVKAELPLVGAGLGVAETLTALNRRLAAELGPREFVALALLHADPDSGRFELANAGLPDPYLVRSGGLPLPVAVPGPRLPLGVRAEVAYETVTVTLAPDDRLLLLTDGAPESHLPTGEPLGYARFAELVGETAGDAGLDLDRLVAAIRAASGPEPDDDWTLVSVARSDATPRVPSPLSRR